MVYDDFPDGVVRERLRYGQEPEDWGAVSGRPCGDCGCPPGGFHHVGCDVEHCALCSEQVLTCGCASLDDAFDSYADPYPLMDWRPLERFFGDEHAPELTAFMYMDAHFHPKHGLVHEYKHVDTRRYLMLNSEVKTFRWSPATGYRKISRKKALDIVYDGVDEGLYMSTLGSLPRREVYPCERNDPRRLPEAS
jgi:hypothetical protein